MITILTPTYNRRYILGNLYNSLKRQTCYNFEWVIIDDGSEDDTESMVREWIASSNNFPIRYYYKENGGQHTALNKGIQIAEGFMIMIVDSDDYLADDAVGRILYWEETIKKLDGFAGVSGLRAHFDGGGQ